MRAQRWILGLATILLTACTAVPPPQAPPTPPADPRATLAVVVTDCAPGERPIAGAAVQLHTAEKGTTNGDGYVKFDGLIRGERGVSVAASGYHDGFKGVAVSLAEQTARICLNAIAPPAPPTPPTPPVPPPPVYTPKDLSIGQVLEIIKRVHDVEHWNLGASSDRNYRIKFWTRAVGIVHFGHPAFNLTPDPRWHIKDAGGGRPISDDVVVLMPGRQFWDCIPGAGANGYSFRCSGPETLPTEQNVYPPQRPEGR